MGVLVSGDSRSRYFDARRNPPPMPASGQAPHPPAGSEISAAEFYARADGNLVHVTGTPLGATLLAENLVLLPEPVGP